MGWPSCCLPLRGRTTRASGAMATHRKQLVGDVLASATMTLCDRFPTPAGPCRPFTSRGSCCSSAASIKPGHHPLLPIPGNRPSPRLPPRVPQLRRRLCGAHYGKEAVDADASEGWVGLVHGMEELAPNHYRHPSGGAPRHLETRRVPPLMAHADELTVSLLAPPWTDDQG